MENSDSGKRKSRFTALLRNLDELQDFMHRISTLNPFNTPEPVLQGLDREYELIRAKFDVMYFSAQYGPPEDQIDYWNEKVRQTIDLVAHTYDQFKSHFTNPQGNRPTPLPRSRPQSAVATARDLLDELQLHSNLLPTVPTFNGDFTKFQEFLSAFRLAVHDRKISTHQKLSALRQKLTGRALDLVNNFGSSPDDYVPAFRALCNRFENKYFAAATLFDRLAQRPKLTSFDDVSLEKFIADTRNLHIAIDNLHLHDPLDFARFLETLNRLPSSLRDEFHEHIIRTTNQIPSCEQLLNFLEAKTSSWRARSFTSYTQPSKWNHKPRSPSPGCKFQGNFRSASPNLLSRGPSQSPLKNPRTQKTQDTLQEIRQSYTNSNPKEALSCFYCIAPHFLYHCSEFKAITHELRAKFVELNKLCKNCLSPKHDVSGCPSTHNCKFCGERHHSLLHENPGVSTPNMNSGDSSPRGIDSKTRSASPRRGRSKTRSRSPSPNKVLNKTDAWSASPSSFHSVSSNFSSFEDFHPFEKAVDSENCASPVSNKFKHNLPRQLMQKSPVVQRYLQSRAQYPTDTSSVQSSDC